MSQQEILENCKNCKLMTEIEIINLDNHFYIFPECVYYIYNSKSNCPCTECMVQVICTKCCPKYRNFLNKCQEKESNIPFREEFPLACYLDGEPQ